MNTLFSGTLYGVGIGPGDPELLTLKAVKILKNARVIAVPKAKIEGESIALDIVRQIVDLKDKEIIELAFPMSKDEEELVEWWKQARREILKPLNAGKDVAFITIGDPLFHSTFIYLMEIIKKEQCIDNNGQKIKLEIIPGISSINAASAATQLPLANRDTRLAILPATYENDRLKQAFQDFDTIVLIKVSKVMDKIISILEELNLKDKAVFISNVGWQKQFIIKDLDSLKGKKHDYFSMIIVKKDL